MLSGRLSKEKKPIGFTSATNIRGNTAADTATVNLTMRMAHFLLYFLFLFLPSLHHHHRTNHIALYLLALALPSLALVRGLNQFSLAQKMSTDYWPSSSRSFIISNYLLVRRQEPARKEGLKMI